MWPLKKLWVDNFRMTAVITKGSRMHGVRILDEWDTINMLFMRSQGQREIC